MSRLPASFDPFLLKDELLGTLRESPLTSQLVPLRAEELIQLIVQRPIVMTLQEQVRTLKLKLEGERVERRTLRTDSKRLSREQQREVGERERAIRALNEQVEARDRSLELLQAQKQDLEALVEEYEAKVGELEHENGQYQQESNEMKRQIEQSAEAIERLEGAIAQKARAIAALTEQQERRQLQFKRREESWEAQLVKLRQQSERAKQSNNQQLNLMASENKLQLQQRDGVIQALKQERFNLKNEINGLKIDLEQSGRVSEALKEENQQLGSEREKLKQTIRVNKIVFDKQRKMVNQRLQELSSTSRSYQRLKASLAPFSKAVAKLQGQYQRMVVWVREQLKLLASESQEQARLLLDQVGSHVDSELKVLSEKLNSRNEQVRVAKSELKMREEILERSEKIGVSSNKEIAELKGELRQRKREEERLRRQLKANYEEYQAKLSKMEKKYVELLNKGAF